MSMDTSPGCALHAAIKNSTPDTLLSTSLQAVYCTDAPPPTPASTSTSTEACVLCVDEGDVVEEAGE